MIKVIYNIWAQRLRRCLLDKCETVYRDLQRHLDGQVLRFPTLKSGADIRMLKGIFTPDEARAATRLTYRFESLPEIHERARDIAGSPEDLGRLLEAAVQKGGIGYTEKNGKAYYRNIPLVVGIFEACIHRLTPEFLADFRDFEKSAKLSFGLSFAGTSVPQFRTIPVEYSITPEHHVAAYDELRTLIAETGGPIVVVECICRKARGLEGDPCKKTMRQEVCLGLENTAKMCIKKGIGREIDRDEALRIARQNEDEGLVLNTSNAKKPEFICGCCRCCCGFIRDMAKLPRPAHFFQYNFYAVLDPDLCTGCGICVERCSMNALEVNVGKSVSVIDPHRCIGCGACVPSCPSGAISMKKKEKETVPPETDEELYDILMAHRKGTLRSAVSVLGKLFKAPGS